MIPQNDHPDTPDKVIYLGRGTSYPASSLIEHT